MNSALKKCFAILLAALLLAAGVSASAEADAAVLKRAVELLAEMESSGNYGCVTNDTNGSPSVGLIQWNAARGVRLMKGIIGDDTALARENLGESLYGELSGGADGVWNRRTLSSSEKAAVGRLLKSAPGVARQDALIKSDVSGYIERAMSLGIRDKNALAYAADIAHQVGSSGVTKYYTKAKELAGSYEKVSLDILYQAALNYATHTKSRRTRVYKLLKENPVSSSDSTGDTDPAGGGSEGSAVESISLTPSGTAQIEVGAEQKITVSFSPAGAASLLSYKSSAPKIASVSADGTVTALRAGKARILVATSNGKRAILKVKVLPVRVKEILLGGEELMTAGDKQTLLPSVLPENATNRKLRFKSSNKRVALVNAKGVVLARRAGKCTIYCRAADGSGAQASLEIRVE